MIKEIREIALYNSQRARQIVDDIRMTDLWSTIGAKVNLVGSLSTGLLMKHRDIDFHIYTPELDLDKSFGVMAKLAAHPSIKKIECVNLIHTEEECIEWHAWYEDDEKELWQIDMIHIRKGSFFDGYAEKLVERLNAILTQDQRDIILQLKYDTPESEKIMGIEYYMAVLRDGVKEYAELEKWRKENPVNEVITWLP